MQHIRDFFVENAVSASEFHATSVASPAGGDLLLIGNDDGLQHSRRLLLERSGFTVISLNSRQALAGEGPSGCRLAVICRSVGYRDAQWIAQLLRSAEPHLPILRFATRGEMTAPEFTLVRRESAPPLVLLAEVGRLLSV